MRTEKFNRKDNAYDGDDIHYAFECNSLSERLDDIDVIVAEVCGENDGYDWYWILQMKDGSFSWAKGGCDYTGWDCQSYAEIKDGFATAFEAIDDLDTGHDGRKEIKECLKKQITEEQPFACYTCS